MKKLKIDLETCLGFMLIILGICAFALTIKILFIPVK